MEMVSARLLFSPAEAGRGKTNRATAAIAATRAACTICTARTSLAEIYGGSQLEPQYAPADWHPGLCSRKSLCQCRDLRQPRECLDALRTGGSRGPLKIRLESDQEASGFAARHDAMVKGERQLSGRRRSRSIAPSRRLSRQSWPPRWHRGPR